MLTLATIPSVHHLHRSLVLILAPVPADKPFFGWRRHLWIRSQNLSFLQRLLDLAHWTNSGTSFCSTSHGPNRETCRSTTEDAAVGQKEKIQEEPILNGSLIKETAPEKEDASIESATFSSLFLKTWSEKWTLSEWSGNINTRKQVFCNRSLNMKSIVAVGFDMDYTLAQYKPETFETLAYHGTVRKLVFDLGYPQELLQWEFDWKYMVRGLVLDKRRGNILKMDRHKYVKVAYHGFQEISRDCRMATYGNTLSRESFDEPDYALIDTLFSLAEAYLFAQLVDFRDSFPDKIPANADYAQMYKDVRSAVDLCHRDGTLKQVVAKDPSKYIHSGKQLVSMLKMLRDSGRMTFLVTNSLWDYTHAVMTYLCGKCGSGDGALCDDEWLNYFDLVITGSAKPSFFADGNPAPLYRVDIRTGMLQNTENGRPLAQISITGLSPPTCPQQQKQICRVFQGGSVAHLHRLLSIDAGAQVLYVGDHIYGDILRSKKQLGWRTMLVVPELEKELELFYQTVDLRKESRLLRQQRDNLEDKIQRLDWELRFNKHSEKDHERIHSEMEELQVQRDKIRETHRQALRFCHQRFHKIWGQLMKTGYQNSRFAHQVERFACLYSSHVTNLCYYSPDKSYRTSEDFMPHEHKSFGI